MVIFQELDALDDCWLLTHTHTHSNCVSVDRRLVNRRVVKMLVLLMFYCLKMYQTNQSITKSQKHFPPNNKGKDFERLITFVKPNMIGSLFLSRSSTCHLPSHFVDGLFAGPHLIRHPPHSARLLIPQMHGPY